MKSYDAEQYRAWSMTEQGQLPVEEHEMQEELAVVHGDAIMEQATANVLADGPEQDQLLLQHLPMVRYLARSIHARLPQHVELDDLVSAGVVGLMDAFRKFNNNKNVPFKSYAQIRIRGAILDSLRVLDWSPRELRPKARAMKEAVHSLKQKLGREPDETEVAAEMKVDLVEYHQIVSDLKSLDISSLNSVRADDSGEEEIAYVAGPLADDPLVRCLQGEMKQHLVDAIDNLSERERMVISLYYYEEMNMKEIGQALGVVESRVSQIHSSVVLQLRSVLEGRSRAAGRVEARCPERGKAGRAELPSFSQVRISTT